MCQQRGHVPGDRAPGVERHHPPENAGSSHTDHAPAAAAAPAPCARAATVTERVKAQDPADAIANQHHLGERAVPSGGEAGRRRVEGSMASSPGTS